MLTYPTFNPIALQLGPLKVHWYGIMYLVGFAVAWYLARWRARQPTSTWTANDVDDLIFYAMLGVILGGRIGYVVFYGTSMWRNDLLYPFKIWEGGMSFHGGLAGVLVATAIFAHQRGRAVIDVFDFLAPLPGIGLMAGRLGNFINGELWGRVTTSRFGMLVPDLNGNGVVGRFPSQLYEAALEGLLLFLVLWLYTAKPRPRWAPAGLFLLLYSASRILVEFVREPDAQLGYLAGSFVTMGMILSLPMFLAGLLMWGYAHRRPQASGNFRRAA
ncbi:MAG: prolipoprotein diacylglyceryl transferase [Steroidobacteraceae bacterium]